jgi:hypothetical protein
MCGRNPARHAIQALPQQFNILFVESPLREVENFVFVVPTLDDVSLIV